MRNRLFFRIGIMALISIFIVSVYACGLFSPYEKRGRGGKGGGGKGGGGGGKGGGGGGSSLIMYDTNGNGEVSKDEYMKSFTTQDANGDGYLTEDEMSSGGGGKGGGKGGGGGGR